MENEFIARLARHAEASPDRPLFKEAGREAVSRRVFYETVHRIAGALLERFDGSLPEEPIAVPVERDVSSIAAMLGVLAAGGWYVPIDAGLPPERGAQLCELCRPALLLLPGERDPFPASAWPKLSCANLPERGPVTLPERDETLPMFGIFTSGSTGTPKLVVKNRRGMRLFIEDYCRTFSFTEGEVFGNQIPFYFDASTKDLFATVWLGAETVILPQKLFSFPLNLVDTLNVEGITSVVWVPSALTTAAKFNVFEAAVPGTLRNVLFVGERMPVRTLRSWRSALPDARFVNLYGSTEVAGNSCYYTVDRDFGDADILPIGRPFDSARVFLLDGEGNPSSEGEICVAGEGLALGYYGDPERTAAVFREARFDAPPFAGRLCHSGDFGRYNERGELLCVNRRDSQIKHMGHRIELGELEAAAEALDFVSECCCLYDAASERILLLTACPEERKRELRRELAGRLPKYMLPHEYVCLPALPHNRNGKLDRAGLRETYLHNEKPEA